MYIVVHHHILPIQYTVVHHHILPIQYTVVYHHILTTDMVVALLGVYCAESSNVTLWTGGPFPPLDMHHWSIFGR